MRTRHLPLQSWQWREAEIFSVGRKAPRDLAPEPPVWLTPTLPTHSSHPAGLPLLLAPCASSLCTAVLGTWTARPPRPPAPPCPFVFLAPQVCAQERPASAPSPPRLRLSLTCPQISLVYKDATSCLSPSRSIWSVFFTVTPNAEPWHVGPDALG